jgi:hypothetical protein
MVEVNIRNIYKNRGAKSARKIPQIFCTTLRIGSLDAQNLLLETVALLELDSNQAAEQLQYFEKMTDLDVASLRISWPWEWKWFGLNKKPHKNSNQNPSLSLAGPPLLSLETEISVRNKENFGRFSAPQHGGSNYVSRLKPNQHFLCSLSTAPCGRATAHFDTDGVRSPGARLHLVRQSYMRTQRIAIDSRDFGCATANKKSFLRSRLV